MKSLLVLLLLASTARADERIYVRGGVLHMTMLSDSDEVTLRDVHGPASLAIMNGPIAGSGASLDAITTPAAIVGIILRPRLSLETVLAPPLHAHCRATGTLATQSLAPTALGLPTGVPALGDDLGEADAAPPVATLVYQLLARGRVRPYAGAGIAMLLAYNAHATNPVLTAVEKPSFHIDPGAGFALQAGVDVALWHRLVARLDVKYVAFLKAHAELEHIVIATPALPLFTPVEVGTATADITLNPLVVQLGVGADF